MDHQDHSSGQEGHGVHVCHNCGWPFPNPHPSARHRRAHKKICGTVEGYKVAGNAQLSVSDDDPKTPINLPEKIIKNIISRLPVKSLVRFTSVSKRWLTIILFDPDFTTLLRRNKTLTRRLLVYSRKGNSGKLKSRNSEMTSFKKVKFPFQRRFVTLLGSCNGLVFVVDENDVHSFRVHVWNPLTGFVKELPIPGFSTDFDLELRAYGVGYLPATDEYKVILSYAPVEVEVELDVNNETEEEYNRRVEEDEKLNFSKIMSLNDGIWRSIEAPKDCYSNHQQGTLVNGSLHWLQTPLSDEIVAFDLAREEFREIGMPNFGPKKIRDLSELRFCFVGCLGGCLCVLRYPVMDACDSIDFWAMREYGVDESWTKLFTLRFSNPEWSMRPLLITENSTVALKWNADIWSRNVFSADASTGVRVSHKQEGEEEPSVNILGGNWDNVIEYEESLASIGGYNGVHHNASQS